MWQALSVESWKARGRSDLSKVFPTVSDIIEQVRREGDPAILRLTARFDKVELSNLRVSRAEIDEAYSEVDQQLLDALNFARTRIEAYHRKQRPEDVTLFKDGESSLGWKYSPLSSMGIYIPGGKASYPSTCLLYTNPSPRDPKTWPFPAWG
jgi:histidinol dehydrogenase